MYDFKAFYASTTGRFTRRILKSYMTEFLADKKLTIAGQGYTAPYLPEDAPTTGNDADTIDRILAIHDLEFADNIKNSLLQSWHVLKPNEGRILIIVPNRHGLWSRKDWTPFGHGMPFNLSQIQHYLQDTRFEIIQTREALFMPPTQKRIILRMASWLERVGRFILPIAAGVHIIEARKTLYAPTGLVNKDKPKIRTIPFFAKPAS